MKAAEVPLRNSLVSQPGEQHRGREKQAALPGSPGAWFLEQDHMQCFKHQEKVSQEHKGEGGQVWNTAFSYFFPLCPSCLRIHVIFWKTQHLKEDFAETQLFLQHYTVWGFFSSSFYLFFPSSFPLRAGGETMIKSSWFYVKFKYAEKVSQYVLFLQGELATSLQSSHVDRLPQPLGEVNKSKFYLWMCFL